MSLNKSVTMPVAGVKKQAMEWTKQDTVWMLSLYGTAIGAGTLFLPIDAGLNGIWPLVIMTLLAFPMTYFSHRALCRFVLQDLQLIMTLPMWSKSISVLLQERCLPLCISSPFIPSY